MHQTKDICVDTKLEKEKNEYDKEIFYLDPEKLINLAEKNNFSNAKLKKICLDYKIENPKCTEYMSMNYLFMNLKRKKKLLLNICIIFILCFC